MTSSDFTLDPCLIVSCPVKTQNQFNPLIREPEEGVGEPCETNAEETARVFSVFRSAIASPPGLTPSSDLSDTSASFSTLADLTSTAAGPERRAACLQAMKAGTGVILCAELPENHARHLSGTADILVRGPEAADERPGYYPIVINGRSVLSAHRRDVSQLQSSPHSPFLHQARPVAHVQFRWDSCTRDLLRMAGLWRLLEHCGHAPIRPTHGCESVAWAGVIGTDRLQATGYSITWVSLSDKHIRTFTASSSSSLWKKRSALNRFDHEHGFRILVANQALAQTGADTDPRLAVAPVMIPECSSCVWWPRCQSQLVDDVSVEIQRAPLDTREILALRSVGVRTVADLVSTDVEAILPEYLPRVTHRVGSESRLRLAAHRGRLLTQGIELERLTTGPIPLPTADIDIDLDIESSSRNRVYLWGFLIHDHRTEEPPTYHCLTRFDRLNSSTELTLAERAATWLRTEFNLTNDTSFLVWHYSAYETTSITRLSTTKMKSIPRPNLTWLREQTKSHFIDLFPIVRRHFFGVGGLGLKRVASTGAGFMWRDPEPGGLNSQAWFASSLNAPTKELRAEARSRILQYNEDDVRATWALRQWLRSLT